MRSRSSGERLSAADASNVVLDARDQVNAVLVAGILGPGGFVSDDGTVDLGHLRAAIAARLSEGSSGLSRFSERLLDDGRQLAWEPCAPDLDWHIRLAEPVEGVDGLAGVCAKLMVTPLAPGRPLWEMLIVPGASADGPGVIIRVHHAVADGVAGVRLMQHLFGEEPEPHAAQDASPGPQTFSTSTVPRRRFRAAVIGLVRVGSMFRATVPRTVLLGTIGVPRGVAFADVDLASLAAGARTVGATVNDALLAAAGVAAEAVLRAQGEPVPDVLPASVPVALPDRGGSGNAVGVMVVGLSTGDLDVSARTARISTLTRTAKSEARAHGTYELTRTKWGSRLFAWLARRQRFIALFVTNVRGPDQPLLIAGAPLVRAWPVAPIQGNVRLGVAALSYAGRLGCAVHVDGRVLRADVLGDALDGALAQIAALR